MKTVIITLLVLILSGCASTMPPHENGLVDARANAQQSNGEAPGSTKQSDHHAQRVADDAAPSGEANGIEDGNLDHPVQVVIVTPPSCNEDERAGSNAKNDSGLLHDVQELNEKTKPVRDVIGYIRSPQGIALKMVNDHLFTIPAWVGFVMDPVGTIKGRALGEVKNQLKDQVTIAMKGSHSNTAACSTKLATKTVDEHKGPPQQATDDNPSPTLSSPTSPSVPTPSQDTAEPAVLGIDNTTIAKS